MPTGISVSAVTASLGIFRGKARFFRLEEIGAFFLGEKRQLIGVYSNTVFSVKCSMVCSQIEDCPLRN